MGIVIIGSIVNGLVVLRELSAVRLLELMTQARDDRISIVLGRILDHYIMNIADKMYLKCAIK